MYVVVNGCLVVLIRFRTSGIDTYVEVGFLKVSLIFIFWINYCILIKAFVSDDNHNVR